MHSLFIFACAIAAAAVSGSEFVQTTYPGPQHLPVIGHNGVPIDTPAVQHATAAHLTHKVEAHARNGDYVVPYAKYYDYPQSHPEHHHQHHYEHQGYDGHYDNYDGHYDGHYDNHYHHPSGHVRYGYSHAAYPHYYY